MIYNETYCMILCYNALFIKWNLSVYDALKCINLQWNLLYVVKFIIYNDISWIILFENALFYNEIYQFMMY